MQLPARSATGSTPMRISPWWGETPRYGFATQCARSGDPDPGAAFKLGDRDLVEIMERLPADHGMRYDETAGQRLIIRDAERQPLELLAEYYGMYRA